MAKLADKFAKFFYDADKDKNGWLTIPELMKAMRTAGFKGSDEDFRKKFVSLDHSKDGKVTFDEYLDIVGKQPDALLKEAMLRYLFRSYDKNESGFLEKSDIETTFEETDITMTSKHAEKVMLLMDTNKDGKVNYEEFLNYYRKN